MTTLACVKCNSWSIITSLSVLKEVWLYNQKLSVIFSDFFQYWRISVDTGLVVRGSWAAELGIIVTGRTTDTVILEFATVSFAGLKVYQAPQLSRFHRESHDFELFLAISRQNSWILQLLTISPTKLPHPRPGSMHTALGAETIINPIVTAEARITCVHSTYVQYLVRAITCLE